MLYFVMYVCSIGYKTQFRQSNLWIQDSNKLFDVSLYETVNGNVNMRLRNVAFKKVF